MMSNGDSAFTLLNPWDEFSAPRLWSSIGASRSVNMASDINKGFDSQQKIVRKDEFLPQRKELGSSAIMELIRKVYFLSTESTERVRK